MAMDHNERVASVGEFIDSEILVRDLVFACLEVRSHSFAYSCGIWSDSAS